MMTSTEWSPSDPMGCHSTAPDLFGGELFGDELIDLYNSDAVVGTNGEIPHLLPPDIHHDSGDGIHHDENLGLSNAAFDDGLGAFRPSTSFNDLTSLLPATSTSVVSSCDLIMHIDSVSKVENGSPTGGKRNHDEGTKVTEPAQKKRAVTKARVPAQSRRTLSKAVPNGSSATSTTSSGVATHKVKEEQTSDNGGTGDNTPDPLSASSGVSISLKSGLVIPSISSSPVSPAVVSPRPPAVAKSEATNEASLVSAPSFPCLPQTGPSTEADFKSVAQAAVTSLILNVATVKPDGVLSSVAEEKVDTSTAHIKALTSSNWVAACTGDSMGDNDDASISNADSKANRARRQNLTPDERARQNRDRNREHARNTRLRKKAYVEELKRTLTELVAQRDAAELEKRHTAQRELEQREVRFRVMEEFFSIRGRNEPCYGRWSAILDDAFTFTLPVTDYRQMVEKNDDIDQHRTEQRLLGATEAMEDASNLSSFLQTLGCRIRETDCSPPVTINYQCDRSGFHMDGCHAVVLWTASTIGATTKGAPMELTFKGNMHAEFSPASNKLISAAIMFDTGRIAAQLQFIDGPKEDSHQLSDCCDVVAAAQAAAIEADALLDSLQMPQLGSNVPSAINFVSSTSDASGAHTVSDKDDSSDEGFGDILSSHFGSEPSSEEGTMMSKRGSRMKD